MKAYCCRAYGGPDVLALETVPDPVPGPRDVLIRVHATTVASGDWRIRSLNLPKGFGPLGRLVFGLIRPRQPVLGTELAGVIEQVGAEVTRFAVGDKVVAFPGGKQGAHAELIRMAETAAIVRKPDNLSFAEAAALPFGAATALHFLRRADIQPGQSLLVIGASGAVGSMMVQIGKAMGAQVTGVASGANRDLVLGLGADAFVDYRETDVIRAGQRYDVIAEAVGQRTWTDYRPILAPNGRYLSIVGSLGELLAAGRKDAEGRVVLAGPAPDSVALLQAVVDMAAMGKIRPVIDRRFAFAEMQAAHALVDSGRKRGVALVEVIPEAAS